MDGGGRGAMSKEGGKVQRMQGKCGVKSEAGQTNRE